MKNEEFAAVENVLPSRTIFVLCCWPGHVGNNIQPTTWSEQFILIFNEWIISLWKTSILTFPGLHYKDFKYNTMTKSLQNLPQKDKKKESVQYDNLSELQKSSLVIIFLDSVAESIWHQCIETTYMAGHYLNISLKWN